MDTAAPEALLGEHESLARSADHMVERYTAIFVEDFRVTTDPIVKHARLGGVRMSHRTDITNDRHAGRPARNHDHRRPLVGRRIGVCYAKEKREIRH